MTMSPLQIRTVLALSCGVLLSAPAAWADGTRFSDFAALPSSAGPTADEATPITFGNPAFQQRSIADRASELAAGKPNTGNWDMNTVNETDGEIEESKGRFLFTVWETGQAGVQRHDLLTGQTDSIWVSPAFLGHVAFDACYWTPWGTLITAEESWTTAAGGSISPYGRLFEFKNPITAPGIVPPLTPTSNDGAIFPHQNVIPRVSHEGIQFDSDGNMYFIDELNGGCLYKYTPAVKMAKVMAGADYFAAGQTFVLRVGDGLTPNATGAYTWVPFTDATGTALPGALTITDNRGVTSVDGRNTTDLAPFKGTDYQRPEDMQIQRLGDREYLYVATTTTNEVYRMDLKNSVISIFANRATIDLATGAATAGSAFASPDNLAIDHEGTIYIIEDRNGGTDNDIWFANDLNLDGDLLDANEGLARWASNGTPGSEFTGLYFDPKDKRRAWVNIQHPASGNDRTIEITIPDDEDNDVGEE